MNIHLIIFIFNNYNALLMNLLLIIFSFNNYNASFIIYESPPHFFSFNNYNALLI